MIWLIGAGGMSVDYVKVLEAQDEKFIVVGRGESSANKFEKNTGQSVVRGGVERFLLNNPEKPTSAIISVGIEHLYSTAIELLKYGVKSLLIEKPGGISTAEILDLKLKAHKSGSKIYIAYNRRFFSSVIKARELIKLDGGVTSFNFELTEWAHKIEELNKPTEVFSTWFLGNSTHVADLAFHLGGVPQDISSYTSGGVHWHPNASNFAGAGKTANGALFNYAANWESAGRWSVEILTKENRYILRPMESLMIQKRGTIAHVPVEIDNSLDLEYKPGLFKQVEAFLDGDASSLCDIDEHLLVFPVYEKMAGYSING
jgi:predicted dehydrogenase